MIPTCDVCGTTIEEIEWNGGDWCGECGCCKEHCQHFKDCEQSMTDLEKWTTFLTEQNVGFAQETEQWNNNETRIWLRGKNVINSWAGCEIIFNNDGSLKVIEVSE